MFFKISILAVMLAGSVQCLEYPAGVSPKDCPNYPYCAQGYIPANYPIAYSYPSGYSYPSPYFYPGGSAYPNGYPYFSGNLYPGLFAYQRPYFGIAPLSDEKVTETEITVESAAPAMEPATPALEPAAPALEPAAQVPLAAPRAPEYPADVDPASCPNYPFCN